MAGEKIRILIVEDEPICQKALKYLLQENYNCEIDIIESATEAFDHVRLKTTRWSKEGYDLIFIDIHLPEVIDGCDLAVILRKTVLAFQGKNTPIVAITADLDFIQDRFYLNTIVDDIIVKPITLEKIKPIIDPCLCKTSS